MLGLCFYDLNPELFKEDVTYGMVEKTMIKTIPILEGRMRLDKRPNMVREVIRRHKALLSIYISLHTTRTIIAIINAIT